MTAPAIQSSRSQPGRQSGHGYLQQGAPHQSEILLTLFVSLASLAQEWTQDKGRQERSSALLDNGSSMKAVLSSHHSSVVITSGQPTPDQIIRVPRHE
jgi:hypothetical protein